MLNRVWGMFFLVSAVGCLWQWLVGNDPLVFARWVEQLFEMAKLAIDIGIGLAGMMAMWLGLMKIGERAGLIDKLAVLLAPLFSRLMPEVPKGDPALGSITMNMAANALGMDNAATPIGIRAMEQLQRLNPTPTIASNAQILFLVLNTSSVTLFPVAVLLYRAQQGAMSPSEVFVPILLATSASTIIGLLTVCLVQRIKLWDTVLLIWFGAAMALLTTLVVSLAGYSHQQLQAFSSLWGNFAIFALIMLIVTVAAYRKLALFDLFIEGAKEGLRTTVTILPYLVAMLLAIASLRASGILDGVIYGIRMLVEVLGFDGRFVDALPTGLMKPFSGSGARAMMLETMNSHGVDSFAAKLAAVMQGSTETTFYVFAVYFGAVKIRNGRHAIPCGLAADFAGISAAIFVSYWFFG
ncbi:nucleoside recognition domain-containing protein [Ferrimonas lipolytica]|uniref:Spore maturation protein n=1 Tax=Ferrimonas lipolytica TaxID=2724191 RepID=A0A6H1UD84_9GAMM|nr:spore maturation protein [Ferrimonas lipolytica]QIZ76550.1 spore maturation protein [Ferrimonas lipolytica]